jgi:hypothetical protein
VAEEERIEFRLARAAEYALQPMKRMFEKTGEAGSDDSFTMLLCLLQSAKYSMAIVKKPWVQDPDARILEQAVDGMSTQECLVTCPEFWYVGLFSLLAETGALDNDAAFKEWTRSLLIDTALHPAQLNRLPVPQQAQKTRSSLAKRIAPLFKGCAMELRDELVYAADKERVDDTELLCMLAVCLSGRWLKADGVDRSLSRKEQSIVDDFWLNYIAPRSEALLMQMADQVEGADGKKGWISVFGNLWASDDDFDIDEFQIEEPPLPENWYYVTNPGRVDTAVEQVVFSCEEDTGTTMENFLRTRKIKPTVKPVSIVTALEHFRDMPEMLRAVMPHEQVENESWHKIKRGKLRILARIEEDGRLLFNVYPRKDWVRRE